MASQTSNPFVPAVKAQLFARVALDGPTGAGKTFTMLSMAEELADGGRIAVVDTERGKAKLYAHRFTFDHLQFDPPYDVNVLLDALRAAEANGYAVAGIDSLTHFWVGEGGVLDEVDAAANRSHGGNRFAGWSHGTPLQRKLVDGILGLELHVIATMRSKMEYVLEDNGRGGQQPRKVGMAPVQRDGLEYEFDVIGDLDLDHRMTITKSRIDVLADKVIQPHSEKAAARELLAFLEDGEPRANPEEVRAHVARVKEVGGSVPATMGAWMAERGFTLTTLTVSQLAEANEHLADLLLGLDESPVAGEPDLATSGDGDGTTSVQAHSEEVSDLPPSGSDDDGVAASPAAGEPREMSEREKVARAQLEAVKSA